MRRLFAYRLAFTAILTITGLQAGYSADKWISVRSKNFLLVGNASESNVRRVGRNLEEFRAGLALLFPTIDKQSPPPITVIVFKDDASFKPYKPLYQGKPATMDGFFQAGSDVNFIALAADMNTPHVIYHEFVHSLTKDTTVALPPWASEGLAEFYGMFEVEAGSKEMLLGRPMAQHIQTLRTNLLPVETLFHVDHDSPFYNEETKAGIFYAQSWAVIHYLMLGENGQLRPKLSRFLALVANGKAVNESFQEAFQKDYAGFEKELQTYIGRYTFPVVRYKLNNKVDFEREMQISSLTDAQVQYYLGDLLLHIQRYDTAQTFLEKAISLDAKFAPSYASMGMLKVRLDKNEEALKFLTQAVQADSKDYMAHYYYAYMLQTVGEKDTSSRDDSRYALMREHLKKCIELAPGYLPAYDMLGYVALNLRTELPETRTLLMKVLQSSPGRQEIRLRVAELMVANEEQQAARVIALPLKDSPDDFVRQRARALVERIERYMENRRALLEYEERRREAEAGATAAVRAQPAIPENAPNEPVDAPPTLTRSTATTTGGGGIIETAKPQINRPNGPEIEGVLLFADCSRGLTLRVGVGNGNVELHSPDPSKIEFVSYTTTVSDSFACGSFRSAPPVRVVYRRSADPRYLGEPLRVEFIEKPRP